MKTGIGLRTKYYQEVLDQKPRLPWFEVITENFMGAGGRPKFVLESVRKNYPVAFHGVGLSIGSQDPLRREYLDGLKNLVSDFAPFIVSDHLSWSRHNGQNSHDLLPIEYTEKTLAHVAARVMKVQEHLGRKLYLENPSAYVMSRSNEMRESEFLRELCRRTGCGVMLDVNNLVVNKYNLGVDYDLYLEDIRAVDVPQFHVAGHAVNAQIRVDTHDNAPDAETIMLLKKAMGLWPQALPLIEWDDHLPELSALISMAREIDLMGAEIVPDFSEKKWQRETIEVAMPHSQNRLAPMFWSYIFSPEGLHNQSPEIEKEFFTQSTSATVGMSVYNSGFFLRALAVLENVFPKLKFVCGALFTDLMRGYLQAYPPVEDSIDFIGADLPAYLATADLPEALGGARKIFVDLAALEKARQQAFWSRDAQHLDLSVLQNLNSDAWVNQKICLLPSVQVLNVTYDVLSTFNEIDAHRSPDLPVERPYTILVFRDGHGVHAQEVTARHADIFNKLQEPVPLIYFVEEKYCTAEEFLRFLNTYYGHIQFA